MTSLEQQLQRPNIEPVYQQAKQWVCCEVTDSAYSVWVAWTVAGCLGWVLAAASSVRVVLHTLGIRRSQVRRRLTLLHVLQRGVHLWQVAYTLQGHRWHAAEPPTASQGATLCSVCAATLALVACCADLVASAACLSQVALPRPLPISPQKRLEASQPEAGLPPAYPYVGDSPAGSESQYRSDSAAMVVAATPIAPPPAGPAASAAPAASRPPSRLVPQPGGPPTQPPGLLSSSQGAVDPARGPPGGAAFSLAWTPWWQQPSSMGSVGSVR